MADLEDQGGRMLITRSRVLPTALVALLVVAGSLIPPLAESASVPNLFVASKSNNGVVEYDGATGALVTAFVPGGIPTGSGGLANPIGLAFRQNGNLLVTSGPNSSVLEYNGHTGAFLGAFVPAGAVGYSRLEASCSARMETSSWRVRGRRVSWNTTGIPGRLSPRSSQVAAEA